MSNKKMHNMQKKFTPRPQSLIVLGIGQALNLFEFCFNGVWFCISKHAQRTNRIALHCMAARLTDE